MYDGCFLFVYDVVMIVYFKGWLDSMGFDYVVIDVGGVGYLVGVLVWMLLVLGLVGEVCMVFIEMLVGEDF